LCQLIQQGNERETMSPRREAFIAPTFRDKGYRCQTEKKSRFTTKVKERLCATPTKKPLTISEKGPEETYKQIVGELCGERNQGGVHTD